MGCCNIKVYRFTLAIIGILIGVSVFPVFGFIYHNWGCASWGLLSGVFAAITLGVHIKYYSDEWRSASQWLRRLMYLGCLGQTAAVVGFITYLVLAIYYKQGLVLEGNGYYLVCVWCFMSWKWSFLLFFYGRRYRQLYLETTGVSPDTAYEKI